MAVQNNITTDVSTLLRIPTKVTNELVGKTCLCIGSIISEARRANESIVVIDIGLGTLSVDLQEMQCKFVPGKDLKSTIKKTLESATDPLELALDTAFTEKLLTICNEVF